MFTNFISNKKSPWISRLENACTLLKVDVVEGEAFLGCGGTGRVFKVKRGDDVLALKIVENPSVGSLYAEAEALDRAYFYRVDNQS